MFLLITAEGDEMSNVIKNLLFSKNIPYYEVKNSELPQHIVNTLRTRFPYFPMLLEMKSFPCQNIQMNYIRNYNKDITK